MVRKILNPLQADERGVSPVIGVILMVAITVILAAVIGTFVLGLGGNMSENQTPQAQFSISEADADGSFTLTHNGGDKVDLSETSVIVNGSAASASPSDTLAGGESTTIDSGKTGEVTVKIRHDPSGTVLVTSTVDVGGTDTTTA